MIFESGVVGDMVVGFVTLITASDECWIPATVAISVTVPRLQRYSSSLSSFLVR